MGGEGGEERDGRVRREKGGRESGTVPHCMNCSCIRSIGKNFNLEGGEG